ncbi:LysR family transcriptional regulator [Microbacterium sp. EST19A]|uniref:helix-turn-helix domain-containing protein n=1 Tax=Microbacterium sp. EST19A TaxID=2862681 RepID=UPI001CBCE979|nr:LysR family transcriptional regulator [Microbacterium sp. EST19A]
MQDLLGRLTALDPDASETLKVVTYFDALVERSVGVESMLRGAAVLSGATVGQRDGRQIMRVRADGVRIDPLDPRDGWMLRHSGPDAVAWIEREGEAHTNDAMILERLALALGIIRARRSAGPESAVELAISSYAGVDERAGALSRLRLTPGLFRVVASLPDPAPRAQHPSAVVATRHGLTRATILPQDFAVQDAWDDATELRRGVGTTGTEGQLPESWSAALIAVRLTTPAEPVLAAADLGALLLVAETADAGALHPDAAALAGLDGRSLELLDAVIDEQSVRAAAVRLGRHHSSVQDRLAALTETLGYDPRTSRGHARFVLARMLLRLAD